MRVSIITPLLALLFAIAGVPDAQACERRAPCWERVWVPGHHVTRYRTQLVRRWETRRVLVGYRTETRTVHQPREVYDPETDTYVTRTVAVTRNVDVPVYRTERVCRWVRERVPYDSWIPGHWKWVRREPCTCPPPVTCPPPDMPCPTPAYPLPGPIEDPCD